jgi:hypothetical protein
MGIRTLRDKHGRVTGFQAIVGAGGAGKSKHVAVSRFGNEIAAQLYAEWLCRRMAGAAKRSAARKGRRA